jgi:hypothetical protein
MTADGPYDDDVAGDKAPGHGRFSDNATQASGRPGHDTDAESSAGALDREKCFRDLQAYDRETGPASGSSDKAQLTDDGGWKWKGLELSAEANRIADEAIAARQKAEGRDAEGNYGEGGITPAMRRVEAELEHGSLVPDTEKFALKSPDRFKEKLAKMISLESDIAPGVHAANIHDGIRFTLLFEGDFYSDGVREAESRIADEGCDLVERKPSWSGEEYKGINSQWRDTSSGQLFEVQFHTPASWDVKQKTHDAYEKIECLTTAPEERARLRAYQREVAASVPTPPRALEFTRYKAEDDGDCQRM